MFIATLSHRAPGDHNCQGVTKKEMKGISQESQQKQTRVLGYIQELLKTRKQTPTVVKVNLMRMKQRAQVTSPSSSSYFFSRSFPFSLSFAFLRSLSDAKGKV